MWAKEMIQERTGKRRRKRKSRDVIKRYVKKEQYAILAIENQDELNYVMPLRNMEYDVADYVKQYRRLQKRHYKMKDLKPSAEYLSGFKESDKLKPVVTIVFYHGKGEWNACQELHDMLDFSKENEKLKKYTPNYKINVIAVQELDEKHFQTGLRELIGMLKRRDDKEQMAAYCQENTERFSNMDDDTYDTISTMIGHKKLLEYKEENRREDGGVDMCKALDDMMADHWEMGKQEGQQEFAAFTVLVAKLFADGRIEEVRIAALDAKRRKELFAEYGIASV